MLRKTSEAVSEGNGPILQQEEYGSGQPTLAWAFREIREKLNELHDEMTGLFEQLAARLEQDARQRRYDMEADETNTKTRKRTEGTAIAVQAMRGNSCTTGQKVQDGPKTSITFGVEAKPPDLPCREDVLVEEGATSPESCLPSLEMRSPTAAGDLLPTGEASVATRTTSNEPPLRFYATEEMNAEEDSKMEIRGIRLYTPRTTAAASGDYLLLPTAGGSLRLNPGKIGILIQAVCEVTSAPVHLWDRGARWFVVGLYVIEAAGDELQRFIGGNSLAL